jgi:hypothetical protein
VATASAANITTSRSDLWAVFMVCPSSGDSGFRLRHAAGLSNELRAAQFYDAFAPVASQWSKRLPLLLAPLSRTPMLHSHE